MSLFGGADMSGLRVTAKSNTNGCLRTTVPSATVPIVNKNNINPASEKPKLDPTDPRVKKLVYSMYRDMLTNYNEEANDFVSQKDPTRVKQDLGVAPILKTIIIRQGNQQGSSTPAPSSDSSNNSNSTSTPSSAAAAPTGGMPPPPPPMIPGAIPAVRLNSEIGLRDKGPPMALANAMMKDKKPFTYTPGGIDLSEIRSPRMAKRIQMNAAAEGVTSPTPAPPPVGGPPPGYLPPAALAAMQPQMAIPVFPQGGFNPAQLNKTQKPSDFAPPPPPPCPPPFMQQLQQSFNNQQHNYSNPPQNFSNQQQNRQQSPPRAKTPLSPPPPPVRSSTPTAFQMQLESRPVTINNTINNAVNGITDNRASPTPPIGVGTGCIYIPPIETSGANSTPEPSLPTQKPIQTKAQAHSQNLGSIYIPPVEQRANDRSLGTAGSSSGSSAVPESPSVRSVMSPSQSLVSTPMTPMTPQLNKAPTPWMNSYNRMQNQPPSTPPYVNPANIMSPWGVVGGVRTIPISMAEDDNDGSNYEMSAPKNTPTVGVRSVGPPTNNARVIPIQIQSEEHRPQPQGTRTIPIQMEGATRRPQLQGVPTPPLPTSQPAPGYQRQVAPNAYNNPMGLYSNQNVAEAYHKQAGEIFGIDRMSISDDNRRTDPIQSKSLRVIQKVAEDDLLRAELQQQQRRLELMGDDKQLMDLFKAQVDEGSSLHQNEEPRFRGAHIPSRAFRQLQSNLPSSPGVQDQPPNYQTQAQNAKGHLTHNIQILMQSQPQSPTPQPYQHQHHIHIQQESPGMSGNQGRVPPSQQKVPEPKKYMGSNIPSRSFKILQAMTAEDDTSASDSEAPADQNSYNSDENSDTNPYYPYPYPYPVGFSNEQDPNGEQGQGEEYASWPENFEGDPNSWDPYTYMSWYYWWYYTSCYWNGYDMTGYEYPANWDPNYCYEGYASDYSGNEGYPESSSETPATDKIPVPPKSSANLRKSSSCVQEDDIPTSPHLPKIVIEGEAPKPSTETENKYLKMPDSSNAKLNDCDSNKNVAHRTVELEENSSSDDDDDDDYESCVEEQMVIKSETGSESNKGTENNQQITKDSESESEEEDEETEPEEDDDGDEGIVEEPETPSSEDSDAATLVDEACGDRFPRLCNVTIEEYQSPNSDSCDSFFDVGKKNRLSTIEELTEYERSRASSVLQNYSQDLEVDTMKEESGEDDDDSDSDSEDLSSVSVIENKSDTQGEVTTATESKREDETTTSDEDVDVDDDEDNENVAAVTVRLPLKLSFSKSKSYRDIATVLVCDSEVCSESGVAIQEVDAGDAENFSAASKGHIMEVRETSEGDDDSNNSNEPAVSYTISLSRQTSKSKDEEVVKDVVVTETETEDDSTTVEVAEEKQDIDFWSQIESSEEDKSQDFWGTTKTSETKKSDDFSASNPKTNLEPVDDFWGSLRKERTKITEVPTETDFWGKVSSKNDSCEQKTTEYKAESKSEEEVQDFWGVINGSTNPDQQQVKDESIDVEKNDFEMDDKKSVSWERKDSIEYKWDNEFNFWDKSSKNIETRRFSHNFEISEAYESDSGMKSEPRRKKVDRLHHKRHSIHGSIWDKTEDQSTTDPGKPPLFPKTSTESPWSYWDTLEKEGESESQKPKEDFKPNQNADDSSSEDENDDGGNANVSVQLHLSQKESSNGIDSDSESEEENAEEIKKENKEIERSNRIEETESRNAISNQKTDNSSTLSTSDTEVTLSINSRLSPALPVSDENSDESSSKSSGTTIGRDKFDGEKPNDAMGRHESNVNENVKLRTAPDATTAACESEQKKRTAMNAEETETARQQIERPIEIRELGEKIKLNSSSDVDGHEEGTCTCHLADRMARAEGLLWRIERFLQESLSLGSEDDSGVMTDLSRQISDVDTDADNDINDNEFLLTAAFAAKQKRSSGTRNNANNAAAANNAHQPTCSHNQSQTQSKELKKRPSSEILLESHTKSETVIETDTVKMRSASERKALRYQRAKTHSRLFQLLQDECSKEDEDDDDDDDYDYETETGIAAPEKAKVVETTIPIEKSGSTEENTKGTVGATSTEERRSRLVPLPIKNFLTSSISCDSNSSPSGSSGVLSPTSPVNRDQLLADIINEFHLRHQQQNQKRLSNFPSKIFKLLQQEFGEEFYQTFDCCADDNGLPVPVSVEGDNTLAHGGSLVQECTIHKSESLKLLEEAAALRSSGSTSFNSKEKSTNHCRKSNATAKANKTTISSNTLNCQHTATATEATEILTVTSGAVSAKDSKFLEVPLRRKKINLNRDPRSPRTKKS